MDGQKIEISAEERNTILAALRLWNDSLNEGSEYINEELIGIATDGGTKLMLDDLAVDALCERINTNG